MVIELKEPGKEPSRKVSVNGKMKCPVCEVSLSMSDRQGIEIDFCPECRGVWLDRGELDKIIERSQPYTAPHQAVEPRGYEDSGRYGRDIHHRDRGKHGDRRKSWLHELFD